MCVAPPALLCTRLPVARLICAQTQDGSVLHHNSQWVKTIDENGRIHNWDWRPVYTALREATNHTYPGYLWHEVRGGGAVHA